MIRSVTWFRKGLRDGIPIALGYLAVSFSLGIAAQRTGLRPLQAFFMSLTNNTSAGQFAALGILAAGGTLLEMAVTQAIINLRYCLMSAALSQKLAPTVSLLHRLVLAFDVTDEVFALSVSVEGRLSPWYSYGLMSLAIPGWALGTLLGTISGTLLSPRLLSALGVALYGMFLAIVLPPSRINRVIGGLVLVAMAGSAAATYLPWLRVLTPGTRIILLTVVIAGTAAFLFPLPDMVLGQAGVPETEKGEPA